MVNIVVRARDKKNRERAEWEGGKERGRRVDTQQKVNESSRTYLQVQRLR